MKLQDLSNAVIANSYNDYQVIPSNFTKVASYTSNTQAASFTPVYQIYIGTTQPADTYTGKVKYTLVHPNTMVAGTFTLAYDANGGTGTMSSNTNLYNFEEFTLPTSTITPPAGYAFAGWCTAQDQTASGVVNGANPQTTCAGTSYADGGTLPTSLTWAGGTATLYAYWKIPLQSSCVSSPMISTVASGIIYMQDIDSSNKATILAALDPGDTYQIKDNRDDEVYCVSKLADGNLWLLDNLALDISDSIILSSLDSTNTNASDTTLSYLKGISTGTASDRYATSAASTIWSDSYSDPRIYIADKKIANLSDSLSSDAKTWRYGVYYNFCAASAGSYCYGDGLTQGNPSGNATEDICPKGWRLPTGDTGGELDTLYASGNYNTVATYRNALHLPLSGYISGGLANSQGSDGYYWSSTRVYDGNMYNLNVDSSSVAPVDDYGRRYSGFSMRCLMVAS